MVMPNPLIITHTIPTAGATKMTTCQGSPTLDAIARAIKDNMSIDPTDKSIPAVTMTMNTPRASIDCHDICLNMLVILRHEKNTSGCRRCKTSNIIAIKRSIPYLSEVFHTYQCRELI